MGSRAPNVGRVGCKGMRVTVVYLRGAKMLFIVLACM